MSTFSVMNFFNADTIINLLAETYKFDKKEAHNVVAEALIASLQNSITEQHYVTQPVVASAQPATLEPEPTTTANKVPTPAELWCSENRERIASELPADTKKGAISAAVKEAWKNLPEEDKSAVKERVKQLKGKTQRRKKNPDAPKAPQNAFMRFAATKRAEVKKELENARKDDTIKVKAADVQKRIGTLWAELPVDQKKPFEDAYESDKASYQIEKEKYEKSGAPAPNTNEKDAAAASAK